MNPGNMDARYLFPRVTENLLRFLVGLLQVSFHIRKKYGVTGIVQ